MSDPRAPRVEHCALGCLRGELEKRIRELEHAIKDAEITLCNDRVDVRIDNALAILRDVLDE